MEPKIFPRPNPLAYSIMTDFSREYLQDIYYVMSLITYQKIEGEGEVSWILWIESSHEDLNF